MFDLLIIQALKCSFYFNFVILCLILLVTFWTGQLSLITINSFAVQLGGFIEIENSCLIFEIENYT